MYHNVIRIRLRQQQRRVAVAQKAEITLKREVIHVTPISTHKRRHEQQQRRLRLMEVGYDAFHNLEFISRGDDYARITYKRRQPVSVKSVNDAMQRLGSRQSGMILAIGVPLRHFARPFALIHQATDVVKALQGAHRGGAYRYHLTACIGKLGNQVPLHGNELAVHLMLAYRVAFDGLERSGSHMKCELTPRDASLRHPVEHFGREVKSCRRRGHRTVNMRPSGSRSSRSPRSNG